MAKRPTKRPKGGKNPRRTTDSVYSSKRSLPRDKVGRSYLAPHPHDAVIYRPVFRPAPPPPKVAKRRLNRRLALTGAALALAAGKRSINRQALARTKALKKGSDRRPVVVATPGWVSAFSQSKVIRGPNGAPMKSKVRSPRTLREAADCIKRKIKTEVLHAFGKTGKGSGHAKPGSSKSKVEC